MSEFLGDRPEPCHQSESVDTPPDGGVLCHYTTSQPFGWGSLASFVSETQSEGIVAVGKRCIPLAPSIQQAAQMDKQLMQEAAPAQLTLQARTRRHLEIEIQKRRRRGRAGGGGRGVGGVGGGGERQRQGVF
ncbi:unnamed protein product [Pleuronectes platessa]|uniref:Uncharacterized protein n=1 Tax=Pleuronectes platessa TaxID=8262 RepID=A0A9N7YCL9_PLEPL|nr:unnamed protein product [Pleuronectes platessa]